jgi:hypothetical protein
MYSSPAFDTDILNKFKKVNRLILIGNGFDIAHGLKSSFKDFIENYCLETLQQFLNVFRFDDQIVSINSSSGISNVDAELNMLNLNNSLDKFLNLKNHSQIKLKVKSRFFEAILNDVFEKKWVDIEMQYFDFLKRALNDNDAIATLNEDFEFIKMRFLNYLTNQIEKLEFRCDDKILSQFALPILKLETKPYTIIEDMNPDTTCILNFNYTTIAENYSKLIDSSMYIPIHGNIKGTGLNGQEPIFGFGDDMDADFEKFELHANEEIFKNIKSFKYLQFGHYRNLIDFIESYPYQIHIYGHSCGLSDRTLLNTIFENENCISIKQFYYLKDGLDDYERKNYAISRHFKSKSELRIKVVNKVDCEPMFQPDRS